MPINVFNLGVSVLIGDFRETPNIITAALQVSARYKYSTLQKIMNEIETFNKSQVQISTSLKKTPDIKQ